MTDTIREQIEKAVVNKIETMKDGDPATDPYGITFSEVTRNRVDQVAFGKKYVAGVYSGPETKRADHPSMRCQLRLIIEFYILLDKTDVAQAQLNFVLGELQRRLAEDHTLGGLAYDMKEEGNEYDVDGSFDTQVSGAIFYRVEYVHHHLDPRASRNVIT